jgi:adenylylsulfate kinase-like enzyme
VNSTRKAQRKDQRKYFNQINLVVYLAGFKAQGKSVLAQNKVPKQMINTNQI